LLAQHVSDTFMPNIRSSRISYKWLLPVVFGAWFSSCRCSVELRVVCPVCGLQPAIRSEIKIHLLHLVGILFPHIIDDARSKPHQIKIILNDRIQTRHCNHTHCDKTASDESFCDCSN
jgi:hypothetical protein